MSVCRQTVYVIDISDEIAALSMGHIFLPILMPLHGNLRLSHPAHLMGLPWGGGSANDVTYLKKRGMGNKNYEAYEKFGLVSTEYDYVY